MKTHTVLSTNKGFTLVELLVTMVVFIVVLVIAAQTFNTIIQQSSKLSKMEETNIEGVVGLEVLRHDLEQTGFGLFWGFLPDSNPVHSTVTFSEADASVNWSADSTNYAKLNDVNSVPRALVGFDSFSDFNSDFLGIKATTVGLSSASQRWTYIQYHNYSTSSGLESRPVTQLNYNLQAGDKVIAIRNNFNDSDDDRLLLDSGGSFYFNYNSTGYIHDDFLPSEPSGLQMHMVYGIKTPGSPVVNPRMPFNRSDFFVSVPGTGMPAFCAPNTGVLYKAIINHEDGRYTNIPLLDCVAGMQVVLGWTLNEGVAKEQDSTIHLYSSMPATDYSVTAISAPGVTISDWTETSENIKKWLQDPKLLREHLKMIKVYILAQEGRRDRGYTYPAASMVVGDAANGETSLTKTHTFSSDQRQYRWKLYRIIVRPKNLVSNQR